MHLLLPGDKFPLPMSNPGVHSIRASQAFQPTCVIPFLKCNRGISYPGILVGLGSGKSFCTKSQWLHEISLPVPGKQLCQRRFWRGVWVCAWMLSLEWVGAKPGEGCAGHEDHGVSTPRHCSGRISPSFRHLGPVPWQWLNEREPSREPFGCELRDKQSWGIQERLLQQLIALAVSTLFSLGIYHSSAQSSAPVGSSLFEEFSGKCWACSSKDTSSTWCRCWHWDCTVKLPSRASFWSPDSISFAGAWGTHSFWGNYAPS